MLLAPGDVFAGYTVIRQLGSGGMGAVFLVRHPRLPRSDVLKLLHPQLCVDAGHVARFLREADLVARLSHRNIVPVLDRGDEDGQLWLRMPYVDGIDAEAALQRAGGLLPAERVVHVIGEVAAALDHAHRQGVVHRDVKPANILLAADADADEPESVFLTDFGIAKALAGGTVITQAGAVLATFDYASPEQVGERPLDARSDQYSLACVLYRLLTGSVPFPGPPVVAAMFGHESLPPPRPSDLLPWLPPALDEVVARGMAKDPADRFESCRDLAVAAARALTVFPDPPGPPYTLTVTRGDAASPTSVTGPVSTDGLPQEDADELGDLVRRTRFFELPVRLLGDRADAAAPPTAGHDQCRLVTVEVAAPGTVHAVTVDLAAARRPPAVDQLVAAIERLGPPARALRGHLPGSAPPTVVTDPADRLAAVAAPGRPTPDPRASGPRPPGASPPSAGPHRTPPRGPRADRPGRRDRPGSRRRPRSRWIGGAVVLSAILGISADASVGGLDDGPSSRIIEAAPTTAPPADDPGPSLPSTPEAPTTTSQAPSTASGPAATTAGTTPAGTTPAGSPMDQPQPSGPRQEPDPGSAASTPPSTPASMSTSAPAPAPAAPACPGEGCEGQSPYGVGRCHEGHVDVRDPVAIRASNGDLIGTLQLVGSSRCDTRWAKIATADGAARFMTVTLTTSDGRTVSQEGDDDFLSTTMTVDRPGVCYSVQGSIRTRDGSYTWTTDVYSTC